MIARRLRQDRSGATAVEFGLIAPVFLMAMLGAFDLGYNMYSKSLLEGAILKAARDSTIEGATPSQVDARVTDVVDDLVPNARMRFTRTSYSNFSDVGRPEDFTDLDDDGICNNGEPFEDSNSNGSWDADRGMSSLGGARDAVLYRVTVRYPRAFPVAALIGQSPQITTVAATVLRNQPYSLQGVRGSTGNCA